MSTILGIFDRERRSIPLAWGHNMIAASQRWPHDHHRQVQHSECFLACLQRYNTPESILAQQSCSLPEHPHLQLIFDGRLDNRQTLADHLSIPLAADITDETLVLLTYLTQREKLGECLLGDFALAIYDQKAHSLFLLRDHHGVRPLFLAEWGPYLAFSSNVPALLSLPWVDKTTNNQWLADLLTNTLATVDETLYQGIRALAPAHSLWTSPVETQKKRYWQLNLHQEARFPREEDYADQFRELLFQAVQCRLRSYGPVASELSGGLDSTTVTAVAAQLLSPQNQSVHAYSHVLPPELEGLCSPFHDEKYQINLLVNLYPNIKHSPIYSRDLGVIDLLKRSLGIHGMPPIADLSLFAEEALLELQEGNIRTLLSGFGGDQLVTSHGGGWQREVESAKLSWFQTWRLATYYGGKQHRSLRYTLGILKRRHFPKDPPPWQSWEDRLKRSGIAHHFAKKNGYPDRHYAHPLRPFTDTVKEREFQVIHSPEIACRVENSAVGAASYGVDYRYPLLDIRLQQFCLSVPLDQKIRHGIKRRLIRQATHGILPDPIRWRDDKSRATVPTVRQRLVKDKAALETLWQAFQKNERLREWIHFEAVERYLNRLTPDADLSDEIIQRSLLYLTSIGLWASNELSPPKDLEVELTC